ncbi:MAG: hypothetical protein WC456_01350 [Patescibacteria group bacterium]
MKKLLNKLKFYNPLSLFWAYILVILMIVAPWFLKSGHLFFTDMVWGTNIPLNWISSGFLLNLIIKGFSFVFSFAILEKIFIAAVLFLILFGGRVLVKAILEYRDTDQGEKAPIAVLSFPSRGSIFILSLFALFNPFVYDRALYGQFGILAAYGCLLFVLAYLLEASRTFNFKLLWRAALFTAIALLFSIHFIFLLVPFYLLFLISVFFRRQEIKAAGQTKKFWLALLFSFFIVLIVNANWLIALALKASPLANFVDQGITAQDLAAFQTAGKTPGETLSNVLLMSGFWGKDQYRYLDLTTTPGWQRSFIFLAPLIIYGVFISFRRRSKKEKIFSVGLILIFIAAVVLAFGVKVPLVRGLNLFLYDHLPFYKGLREPQKWVAVIIPIYLYYLTIGAAKLRQAKIASANRAVAGVILAAVIIMAAPSLLWGFNRQVIPTPYPADWYETDQFLINRAAQSYGCNDRILFLPWHLYMHFNWVGKIVANPAPHFFTCQILSGTNMEWGGIYDNSQSADGQIIAAWLADQGRSGAPLLAGSPVRYIILAKEVDFASYLWLNTRPYLQLIKETPTLLVYEIE